VVVNNKMNSLRANLFLKFIVFSYEKIGFAI
jgi:hypothetical protein